MIESHGEVVVRDLSEPAPRPGETLVRPQYVGLCGTDLELFAGTMPYFADGVASYPIRPGHEISAITTERTEQWEAGTRVVVDPVIGCGACTACQQGLATLCDAREEIGVRLGRAGGAAELLCVPEANLHRIPDGVSIREAPLVEPGVTALHAVQRVMPRSGQLGAVVGAGTLGTIATQLLRSRGVAVEMPVLDQVRAELVEAIGARPVRVMQPQHYDLVIETAGTPDAVRSAIDAVKPGGYVALVGIQAAPVDRVEINQIVLKDLRLHGVINGPGLYDAMLDELASGAVDARLLIDRDYELVEVAAAFRRLQDPRRQRPKILLRVGDA